ncbi:TPA: RusA family crossover junction endodeoxyribonuclease [Enterococcus faecium]
MFKIKYGKRPQPAERPRARFAKDKRSYYMYTPPNYQSYLKLLIESFNQYEKDPSFSELFDKKKIVYGWSVKIIFKLKGKGKNPFYGKRPDIDNLFKAVADALMETEANKIQNGYEVDENGNQYLDHQGLPIPKYKKKIDDSRIVHAELLKLRVDTEEEEGFTLIIRNVGKDDIE